MSRTGRYKMLSIAGAVLSTTGMFLLARLGPSASANAILWCLVVAGFGFGAAQPVYALVVQNAFYAPFLAAVSSVQYIDLRMRKEAFDVELLREAGIVS